MGLDVTGYSELKKCNEDDCEEMYVSSGDWEQSNMKEFEGEIKCSVEDTYDFRAGSYGGYNRFRDELCKTINNVSAQSLWSLAETQKDVAIDMPFFWLINFTDCDGYIGTSFCEILYNDFCNYEEVFVAKCEDDSYIEKYLDFKEAFKLGKNNGLVIFR